jgi:hypothetical protein
VKGFDLTSTHHEDECNIMFAIQRLDEAVSERVNTVIELRAEAAMSIEPSLPNFGGPKMTLIIGVFVTLTRNIATFIASDRIIPGLRSSGPLNSSTNTPLEHMSNRGVRKGRSSSMTVLNVGGIVSLNGLELDSHVLMICLSVPFV